MHIEYDAETIYALPTSPRKLMSKVSYNQSSFISYPRS